MISINKKLKYCVIGNACILLFIIFSIINFKDNKSKYLRYGPHPDLILISIAIDNYIKYFLLVFFIIIIKVGEVFVSEIAHPILFINIYNCDKKVVKDFTKLELQIYGNSMYLIDSIRRVFLILINISQIDIAIWGVVASEITSLITIRMLLNEKKFKNEDGYEEILNFSPVNCS